MNVTPQQVKKLISIILANTDWEDNWETLDDTLDVNLWSDDTGVKHVTVYPVVNGETQTQGEFISFDELTKNS